MHRYRSNMLGKIKLPIENGKLEIDETKSIAHKTAGHGEVEHVAIFDEAQRSWDLEHLAGWLARGGSRGGMKKVPDFPMSEAEFLIWSLDLRKDWAVIVCLVGGGQEINTGEAGIGEWIRAVNETFPDWKVRRYFFKEDIQITNRYMQRCSLGKCRSKPRDIISHLLEWLLSKPNKQTKITSIGKDAEKRESLCTPGRNVNRYSHYGNCMEVPQKIKNRTTIRSSNSTCGYFSRENKDPSLKSYVYAMFILVLFTITKI